MRIKSLRTEIKNIEIYAILSPDTRQVFVGKTKFPNHYQAYKDHARLQKKPTKELFKTARETQIFPVMYLLERLETTETIAYGHVIAWIKYFLENGFQVLAQEKNLDYAYHLTDETKLIFSSIKHFALHEIITENKILVSNYKPQKKKIEAENDTPNKICFYISPDEYEEINKKSEQAGMSMSKYCKQIVMDGAIVRIEFSEFSEELRAIKRVFREIQLGIYQSGKYFPADLENMQKLIAEVNDIQQKVIRSMERQFKKIQNNRGENIDESNKN